MAKVPPLQRLRSEDFQEQNDWIGRLLAPLNTFQERIISSLQGNLTIADNMAAEVKEVRLDGTYPVKLPWGQLSPPKAVVVGGIRRNDGSDPWSGVTAAVQAQWQFKSTGQLHLTNVVGITPTAAAVYYITLLCYTG